MSNEDLASLILKHDPAAREWVFNFYCSACARYLYPEDLNRGTCKKCKEETKEAIGHAIPFITSATALEKLIVWIRDRANMESATVYDKEILTIVQIEISGWLNGRLSTTEYRLGIVTRVCRILELTCPRELRLGFPIL